MTSTLLSLPRDEFTPPENFIQLCEKCPIHDSLCAAMFLAAGRITSDQPPRMLLLLSHLANTYAEMQQMRDCPIFGSDGTPGTI